MVVAALTMAAGILAAFMDLFRRESQRRTEERLLLQRGELIRENYENLRKHNEEIQTLRHDLRHHVTALQGLCREGDMEEIQRYLESLSQRPELNRISGYTVHPAVDAVLTAMLARGAEAGVCAEAKVDLPPELPIPNSDLCPLLMNLLENALEANEKAPEGAEKWLRVTLPSVNICMWVWRMPGSPRWTSTRRRGCTALPSPVSSTVWGSSPPGPPPGSITVSWS